MDSGGAWICKKNTNGGEGEQAEDEVDGQYDISGRRDCPAAWRRISLTFTDTLDQEGKNEYEVYYCSMAKCGVGVMDVVVA